MTNPLKSSSSGFRFDLIVVGLCVLLAVLFLQLPFGLPNTQAEATADSTADWLVTRAAYDDGASPYDDIVRLADRYHTTYLAVVHPDVSSEETVLNVHFRTPGALLLQTGMILMSPRSLWFVMGTLTGTIAGFLLVAARRLGKLNPRSIRIALIGLFFSNALVWALIWGAQSGIVAGLVALGWMLIRKRDSASGGFMLALAALLKLFPLLLVVVLVKHRRIKAAASMLIGFIVANALGMSIFSLNPSQITSAASIATSTWLDSATGNGSIAQFLHSLGSSTPVATIGSGAVAVGVVLLAGGASKSLDQSMGFILIVGLLGVPLSWSHYDLVLIPVVGYLWTQAHVPRLMLQVWVAMFLLSRFPGARLVEIELGSWILAQRLVLLAAATTGLLATHKEAARPIEVAAETWNGIAPLDTME